MVRKDLSGREKQLLQLLGTHPYLTNEELSRTIGFKYAEYVSTLQKKLQKREYLIGPYMEPDLGMIFKNTVTNVRAFIMFDKPYNYIKSLLKEIECWLSFLPLEEGLFRKYVVGFLSTDVQKLKNIFDYLTDNEVIQYYHFFEQKDKWKVINPTFLINGSEAPVEPDFDHLLDEISVPDLTCGPFVDVTLSKVAKTLIMYLWNGTGECDLRRIIRIEKKFRVQRRKELRDMLRKEKWDVRREELKTELRGLKGELPLREFKETYRLLMNHGVFEKIYYVWPFPPSKCSRFMLLLKCESLEDTKRIIFNFGRNTRIFTRVAMGQSVETGEWYGTIYAVGDPFLGGKLMTALDRYPEIVDRKLFPMRSYPSDKWETQSITMEYYDPKMQSLTFPYDSYFERVKQRVEEDG